MEKIWIKEKRRRLKKTKRSKIGKSYRRSNGTIFCCYLITWCVPIYFPFYVIRNNFNIRWLGQLRLCVHTARAWENVCGAENQWKFSNNTYITITRIDTALCLSACIVLCSHWALAFLNESVSTIHHIIFISLSLPVSFSHHHLWQQP